MANRAKELVRRLTEMNMKAAAAESCTAGLAADLIARIPGASKVWWGSWVSYTPEAKMRMLGVREETLAKFGAVSRETACEMAVGALGNSNADYAFSVTGVAGPGSDNLIPAGTVWIATVKNGKNAEAELFRFSGSRNSIRKKAAKKALEELIKIIP